MIYYSLEDTFSLLSRSVGYIAAKELVEKCKSLGMEEHSYSNYGFDFTLPDFDKGYVFHYKTNNNERVILEILEKDNMILQAGIQIIYSATLFLSKIKKHFIKVNVQLLENYYGVGVPTNIEHVKTINYGDSKQVCYISKSKVNNRDVLTLRIGDKKFWS